MAEEIRGCFETIHATKTALTRGWVSSGAKRSDACDRLRGSSGVLNKHVTRAREGNAHARRSSRSGGPCSSGAANNGNGNSKPKWKQNYANRPAPGRECGPVARSRLAGLGPQLQESIEARFSSAGKDRMHKTIPDFARQRGDLVHSIQLTLVERFAGKGVEEQLARMFRETAAWLRLPAGVAVAGGIVTVIVAMSSAAAADVTGVLAASAAIIGTVVAFNQRKNSPPTRKKWKRNPRTGACDRGANE